MSYSLLIYGRRLEGVGGDEGEAKESAVDIFQVTDLISCKPRKITFLITFFFFSIQLQYIFFLSTTTTLVVVP